MFIKTMVAKDFKIYWRDRKAILMMLVLPLFFVWLFVQALSPYLFTSKYSQKFGMAMVDKDQTFNTKMITRQLEETDYMKGFITVYETDEKTAMRMIRENRIAGAVIVPKGFTASLYSGDNLPVMFIGNRVQKAQADQMKNELTSATDYISAGQSGVKTVWNFARDGGANERMVDALVKESVFEFMTRTLGRNEVYKEVTLSSIPKVSYAEYFTAALTVVFVSFLGIRGSKSLVQEKEAGVLRRFRAAPVRLGQVFAGKFLAIFLLLFFQISIIVLAASFLFDNYIGNQALALLQVLAATSFAVAAWTFFLAVIALYSKAADLLSYLGTFLLAIIGGNIYPLFSLPESVKVLSDFTFNKWAMNGLLKIFAGEPSVSVAGDALLLAGIGGVLLLVSVVLLFPFWRK